MLCCNLQPKLQPLHHQNSAYQGTSKAHASALLLRVILLKAGLQQLLLTYAELQSKHLVIMLPLKVL